jgi:two-component system phosphate regulon sensor histidine kinase PhoR
LSRKIGIFWKYFIAYSAMATAAIFVLAVLMNMTIREQHQDIILDDLRKYAFLAREASRTAFDGALAEADELTKELGRQTGARITLIATDGTVLGDSERNPAEMEDHSERPEIKKALSGGIGTSARYSTTLEERMNYVAVPVIDDGRIKGVVRVSLKLQAIEALIGMVKRRIVYPSIEPARQRREVYGAR